MRQLLIGAVVAWVAVTAVRTVVAQAPAAAPAAQERPLDAMVLAWDKGADKVDVSKYPAEVKKNYKVFSEICAQCHPLARAVNCDFALEEDWERYIKRMMRRGRSLVTPDQAEAAYEFAIYDSKIRKKDLYDKKLKIKQQGGL
jgi:cytochrome c5